MSSEIELSRECEVVEIPEAGPSSCLKHGSFHYAGVGRYLYLDGSFSGWLVPSCGP